MCKVWDKAHDERCESRILDVDSRLYYAELRNWARMKSSNINMTELIILRATLAHLGRFGEEQNYRGVTSGKCGVPVSSQPWSHH